MANIRNSLQIWNVKLRIPNRLAINSPRVLINRFLDILWIRPFDEFTDDVEFLHVNTELSRISDLPPWS